MKISTIIFTLILIYNSVLSFVLLNPSWCSDSKQNKMYSTFTNAYLFNLIITTIIIISIATESYVLGTLLGGIILASYGWLFATSYTLYKEDNTPECLKKIGMTTMVFASLFMILIPVAVLLFNESINSSVIKSICGDETGNNCKTKITDWYRRNVNDRIDKVTKTLNEKELSKNNCKSYIKNFVPVIITKQTSELISLDDEIKKNENRFKDATTSETKTYYEKTLKEDNDKKKRKLNIYLFYKV